MSTSARVDRGDTTVSEGSRSWWNHNIAILASLVVFFPVGLWLIWRYSNWRPQFRWGWTIVLVAFWAWIFIQGTVEAIRDDGSAPSTAVIVHAETPVTTSSPSTPLPTQPSLTVVATAVNTPAVIGTSPSSTISIDGPADHLTTAAKEVIVLGHGTPNDTLRFNKKGPDPKISVDAAGNWSYKIELSPGNHKLSFHRDGHNEDKIEMTIDYQPTDALTVDDPINGSTTAAKVIAVSGTTAPGAQVRYEASGPDPKITADAQGHWVYPVTLKKGENTVGFHVQDSKNGKVKVSVVYIPSDFVSIQDPTDGLTTELRDIVVSGSSKPGAQIRFVVDRAADPKIIADINGHWEYGAHLDTGRNELRFHIEDLDDVKTMVAVNYVPPAVPTTVPPPPVYKFRVTPLDCSDDFEIRTCTGTVTNISDKAITDVSPIIHWTGGTDSDLGEIAFNPILPGQTSEFTVYTLNPNPEINAYTLGFKKIFGRESDFPVEPLAP